MNATAEPEVVDNATEDRHLLVHLYCRTCAGDPPVSLCSFHLTGPDTDEDAECVVCVELSAATYPFCPACGVDWRLPPRGGAS